MRTRSQSRNSNRQQQQVPLTFVELFNIVEPIENQAPPVVTMADKRTMAQLLEAPTKGYEDVIIVPKITADNFELKHGLLTLVQNKQFFGHDKKDPHAHIRYFNKITSKMKFPNVPNCFNDLLRACPHHGFSELHQLDTFYNALNSNDQDSSNSAAGGNFLDKMPRDCIRIIESKSKVRNSRNKPVVAKVSTSNSTPGISPDVAELKDMVKALLLNKKNQSQAPAPVKAVEESYVTCGGAHSYQNYPATDGNVYRDNIQEYISQAAVANFNQGNTSYRPPMANQIRPPSFPPVHQAPPYQKTPALKHNGVAYQGPTIPTTSSSPPKVVERETELPWSKVDLLEFANVNAAHSKTTVNAARPMSYLSKTTHSTVKRPIHKNTTFKNSNFNQRVNTVKDKNVNTVRPKAVVNAVRPKAVVNAVKGNNVNAVKASACRVWKPKNKVLDHVSKHNSASITLKKFDYVDGNLQMGLHDQGVIDSGCSRQMTKNMSYLTNYKEIDGGYVAFGGNSKGGKITGRGTKACDDTYKARMEKIPGKYYILLPLWTANPSFSQISKSSPDAGFKPSSDDRKKDDEDSRNSEGINQEKEDNVNSTNNVNAASTNEVNVVGAKTSIELPDDPNMPELEDIVYSDDDEDVGVEADMNNLDAFMPVSPIPTTRVHKDHPVEQIIRDLNSAPQTRRMTKNLEEHGLFSSVQQRTNHKDFQNCLFACFLSQEEPKKVIHALKDPSWIEAMQEELLQFKLQEVWTLVDLPNGKRAIGTK
ncbi:hypothetical protein Tco_1183684 [Tanacetum coccineum]